jgi:hypothetical protein
MKIKLAYSNHYAYVYDHEEAKAQGFLFEFELDVADLTPVSKIVGNSFRSNMLDGGLFVLPSRTRRSQGFVTKPDLMLNIVESNGEELRLYEAVSRWYFARSKWINTGNKGGIAGSLIDAEYDSTTSADQGGSPLPSPGQLYSPPADYEKVETEGDFVPEKFEGMLMAQRVTVAFQTVRAFSR